MLSNNCAQLPCMEGYSIDKLSDDLFSQLFLQCHYYYRGHTDKANQKHNENNR